MQVHVWGIYILFSAPRRLSEILTIVVSGNSGTFLSEVNNTAIEMNNDTHYLQSE